MTNPFRVESLRPCCDGGPGEAPRHVSMELAPFLVGWLPGFPRCPPHSRCNGVCEARRIRGFGHRRVESRLRWPSPTTRSVPMPSLPKPRLKRSRARVDAPPLASSQTSRPSKVTASAGSTSSGRAPVDRWLEEHFEFHPLDYEDVPVRNQQPKIDEYEDYSSSFSTSRSSTRRSG